MAKKKKKINWNKIFLEYRTGQFNVSELARRNSCSHTAISNRAKKEGWHQDQAQQVRDVASEILVKEDAREAQRLAAVETFVDNPYVEVAQSEIELAAETRVAVLRSHRKDISALRIVEAELLKELKDAPRKTWVSQFQGDVVTHQVTIPVTEKCQALANLTTARNKRIILERQAFNLNDSDEADDGLPTVILHDPGQEGDDQ